MWFAISKTDDHTQMAKTRREERTTQQFGTTIIKKTIIILWLLRVISITYQITEARTLQMKKEEKKSSKIEINRRSEHAATTNWAEQKAIVFISLYCRKYQIKEIKIYLPIKMACKRGQQCRLRSLLWCFCVNRYYCSIIWAINPSKL